jgi:hypothetical protein
MRSDSPSWRAAKGDGDAGELRAVRAWARAGFSAYLKPGPNTHDLLTLATVEVKRDRKAVHTGRVAIEVAYRGRPSGLATSVAKLWQIDTGLEVFILTTARLRELVNGGPFHHTRGGDGLRSDLILVPLADLRRSALLVLPGEGL